MLDESASVETYPTQFEIAFEARTASCAGARRIFPPGENHWPVSQTPRYLSRDHSKDRGAPGCPAGAVGLGKERDAVKRTRATLRFSVAVKGRLGERLTRLSRAQYSFAFRRLDP